MKSALPHALGLAALNIAFISSPVTAAWEIDTSFHASVANGIVHALAATPNGAVLVGGEFSQVNGRPIRSLAKLNATGSLDPDFLTPDPEGAVFTLALGTDGKIFVGGSFDVIAGASKAKLAGLTANGSLDPDFQIGSRAEDRVDCLAVASRGRIVFGGPFRRLNAETANYVGRLAANGSVDLSFSSGLSPNLAMEAGVDAMAVQSDGKIVVGGNFNTSSGFTYLTRLNPDGSVDPGFSGDHGPILYTKAILVLGDGKLLVCGTADSSGRGFVRRLNSDGSIDASFAETVLDRTVEAMAIDGQKRLIIGGGFTQVNGSSRAHLALLGSDGDVDEDWAIEANGLVKAVAWEASGRVVVGGVFTEIGGVARTGIARVKESSVFAFSPMSTPAGGRCHMVLKAETGKTYVIEVSNDLSTWSELKTCTAMNAGLEVSDSGLAHTAQRFFRARLAN